MCPPTGMAVEQGLTPDALLVARCGKQQFGQITTMYGVGNRPANTDDDHQTGRAVDLMIPGWNTPAGSALGWQVASWMRAHHAELGVHYIIYSAKIWNIRPRRRRLARLRQHHRLQRPDLAALRPRPRVRVRQLRHRPGRGHGEPARRGVDGPVEEGRLPDRLRLRLLPRPHRAGLPGPARHPRVCGRRRHGDRVGVDHQLRHLFHAADLRRHPDQLRQPARAAAERRRASSPPGTPTSPPAR